MKQSYLQKNISVFLAVLFLFSYPSFSQVTAPDTAPFVPDTSAAIQSSQAVQSATVRSALATQDAAVAAANAAAYANPNTQAAADDAAQKAALIQVAGQICPYAIKSLLGGTSSAIEDNANQVLDATFKGMETPAFVPGIDQNKSKFVGSTAAANSQFANGCQNFMTKDGKLGQWGQWSLANIQSKKNLGNDVPKDITNWCPNYPSMSKDERDMFWVWILSSMSSSESNCITTKPSDNPNAPNGTALGLFQLEYNKCPKARDLHNPQDNITCAIDMLDREMGCRDTLMKSTGQGKCTTYWGVLRIDDWNIKRGYDVRGAQATRNLMSKYPYCRNSSSAHDQ